MSDDDEPLLPTEEAAPLIQVKPATMVMWRHDDTGPPYVKVGRLIFYRPSHLKEWLKTRVVVPGRRAASPS
jgi:hypothetical protein